MQPLTIDEVIQSNPEYKQLSRSPHKDTEIEKLPAKLRQLAALNREGTTKLFTPIELYTRSMKYLEHIKNNPIISNQLISAGSKAGEVISVERPRMPSEAGLCLFLGVNSNYINQLRDQVEGKEDELNRQYSIILRCIKDSIHVNRIENAAVREYDGSFIAKLEGITDKIEHSGTVNNTVTAINFVQKSVEEVEASQIIDVNPVE